MVQENQSDGGAPNSCPQCGLDDGGGGSRVFFGCNRVKNAEKRVTMTEAMVALDIVKPGLQLGWAIEQTTGYLTVTRDDAFLVEATVAGHTQFNYKMQELGDAYVNIAKQVVKDHGTVRKVKRLPGQVVDGSDIVTLKKHLVPLML